MSSNIIVRTISELADLRWMLPMVGLCLFAVPVHSEDSLASLLRMAEEDTLEDPLLLTQFTEFGESLDAIESPVTEVLQQLDLDS
ncbi:MAG: hypothetical protein ABJ015_27690, partial [Rhodopirellula bahusiensis]